MKVQNEASLTVPPAGQTEEWKALKHPVSRQQMGIMQSGKHMGVWGEMGDGAGKRVMKCVMCTDNDKEGSG
jgi:hypothetical protein